MAAMDDLDIQALTQRISQLIDLCDQLKLQNQHLQAQERLWRDERLQLIEKNDLARQKVEAMILRLKSLEHAQRTAGADQRAGQTAGSGTGKPQGLTSAHSGIEVPAAFLYSEPIPGVLASRRCP